MSYRDKLLKVAEHVRRKMGPPGVFDLNVLHDLDCALLMSQGKRECTCDPEFWVNGKQIILEESGR